MVLLHLGSAHQVHVPAVKGMRAVVAFLNQHAPHGYIFYDGYYDGLFSFYIRAHDPQFERGVIVGRKLLYASAIFTDWRLTELVSSPAEVVAAFRQHCGCQWLVIARSKQPLNIAAVHHLYTALEGPEFQLMQSFPVQSPLVAQVDVYRFLLPAAEPAERDFPFPYIAPGAVLHIKPLCKGFKSCALRDEYPRGQSGLKAG
jgi:hypothetical protein